MYGSDPFAYDLAAALAATAIVRRDVLEQKARLREAEAEHNLSICLPVFAASRTTGESEQLQAPTRQQLDRHRSKFEPTGHSYARARTYHHQACDEVAKDYGLNAPSLKAKVHELRAEGLSPVVIAGRIGADEFAVRRVLKAAAA